MYSLRLMEFRSPRAANNYKHSGADGRITIVKLEGSGILVAGIQMFKSPKKALLSETISQDYDSIMIGGVWHEASLARAGTNAGSKALI